MFNIKKLLPLFVIGALLIAGCGSKSSSSSSSTLAKVKEEKTIVAAAEGSRIGLAYLDKNNELTGYEVEVLKEAAKRAGYKIQFKQADFADIFAGVAAGRYQIGFGSMAKNPTREEKYTFTKVPHYYEPAAFAFPQGFLKKHPVKKIDDIGGLRTYLNPAKDDSWQRFAEAFNKKFPEKSILITYSNEKWSDFYRRLNAGEGIDILKTKESRIHLLEQNFGYHFDFVVLPQSEMDKVGKLTNPNSYFLFPKTEEGVKMAEDFDKAIDALQKDGTLSKLSMKFLGSDYSSKANYEKTHQVKK
jgi:ABC-type amino acid transport substrate-binding protein